MMITKSEFGVTFDRTKVTCFRLQNSAGAYADILDYGCVLQSISVPDRNGKLVDVCLGYDTIGEYESNGAFLGTVVGRHANRIGKGEFTLSGQKYTLALNDGPNHLHGGNRGFDKYVWSAAAENDRLTLSRVSADMEEGYPGKLDVTVEYRLTDDGSLELSYHARSDRDTVVNLTNHAYFNLSGHNSGSVLGHTLSVVSDRFTENDAHCLPTGKILEVAGTPFDFRTAKPIGRDISADDIQLKNAGGYDHNWIIGEVGALKSAAELYSPETGIAMSVATTMPGMQVYSANFLTPRPGKSGAEYGERGGLCLETQYFPNSLAHPEFPSPILRAGEEYSHKTCYKFSVR